MKERKRLGQVDLFTRRVRNAAPAPRERELHIAVADALRVGCAPGWLWWHCPNGELRTDATGALLLRMGVKRGVSDLHLLDPEGRFHALELKRRGKKPNDEQRAFLLSLFDRGCPAAWADNYEGAIGILKGWGALSDRFHPQ